MYQLTNFSPADISKVRIANQQKIKDLTGSELDPLKAFEVIKAESNGFTDDNEKAKEADKLFYELLKKNQIEIQENQSSDKPTGDKNTRLRLRERERIRMLSLLELELQMAGESK